MKKCLVCGIEDEMMGMYGDEPNFTICFEHYEDWEAGQ